MVAKSTGLCSCASLSTLSGSEETHGLGSDRSDDALREYQKPFTEQKIYNHSSHLLCIRSADLSLQ